MTTKAKPSSSPQEPGDPPPSHLPYIWGGAKDKKISFRNGRTFPQVSRGNGVLVALYNNGIFQIEHKEPPVIPKPPDNIVELDRRQARALYLWLGHHLDDEPVVPQRKGSSP